MTSKLTREQATDTEIQMLIDSHEKGTAMFLRVDAYYLMAKELQERRKAERDSEPVAWIVHARTGDQLTTDGGYVANAEGLLGLHSTPLYRHAQQPVVPDESYQQLSELYHAQEKRLFKIAQRIKGPAFDKYAHPTSRAIDVLEVAIFGEDEACRAATLQAGNSQVIPGAEQRISDAVELLKKAAPAMLSDNSGPDGPLAGRVNSPVIPDGYVMVPKVVTPEISNAINEVGHRCTCGNCSQRLWDLLLAATPQEVK